MPRQRDQSKKILDWEDLERAPNTRGAFSFLKSAAEIVNIRRDQVVVPSTVEEKLSESDPTTVASMTTVVESRSRTQLARYSGPRFCYFAQDGHSLGESALYHYALVKRRAQDRRHENHQRRLAHYEALLRHDR